MNSAERKEARYQRRVAQRASKKSRNCGNNDNFDEVFTYANLYAAYRKCRRGVAWKASTQKYIATAPLNVYHAFKQLQSGKYRSPAFSEFDIFERGKKRHIRSTIISDRVVQRCLCDNALVPVFNHTFIHDNGACMQGKGYDFAINRLQCHLQRYIRKHGTDVYILLGDLQNFFDSIKHETVHAVLEKNFSDRRIVGLTEDLVRQFDPDTPPEERKGLGLGSQISQVLAPAVAGALDHYVKEVLGIEYYGRYMDDIYLIHPDRAYLTHCRELVRQKCEELGLKLNEKKTQIVSLRHGFTWLKARWFCTDSGKIIRKIHRTSITRQRRKLKKLQGRLTDGRLVPADVRNSWQSWRSHALRFDAWHTLKSMERLYNELFVFTEDFYHDLSENS